MMISKGWVLGVLTLTMVACLIGLLAFTGESVHRTPEHVELGRAVSDTTPTARPGGPVEPQIGPTDQGNGLMLTY
jgi:hypothetical protein